MNPKALNPKLVLALLVPVGGKSQHYLFAVKINVAPAYGGAPSLMSSYRALFRIWDMFRDPL